MFSVDVNVSNHSINGQKSVVIVKQTQRGRNSWTLLQVWLEDRESRIDRTRFTWRRRRRTSSIVTIVLCISIPVFFLLLLLFCAICVRLQQTCNWAHARLKTSPKYCLQCQMTLSLPFSNFLMSDLVLTSLLQYSPCPIVSTTGHC